MWLVMLAPELLAAMDEAPRYLLNFTDVVLLTPDFRVAATVIDGRLAYQDEAAGLTLQRRGTGELRMPVE